MEDVPPVPFKRGHFNLGERVVQAHSYKLVAVGGVPVEGAFTHPQFFAYRREGEVWETNVDDCLRYLVMGDAGRASAS